MENIGASVGIVIDDKDKVGVMSDDGTGGGIRIPSMLISRDAGTILIDWFEKASATERASVVLIAEFELIK